MCELAAAGEGATQMPCTHAYHEACITKWLRSHNTCPVCRCQVEADETPRPPSSLALLPLALALAQYAGCYGHGKDDVLAFDVKLAEGALQTLDALERDDDAAAAAAAAAAADDDAALSAPRRLTNAELYALASPARAALPYVYDHFEWPHCAEEGYPLRLINATRDGAAGDGAAGYVGHPV